MITKRTKGNGQTRHEERLGVRSNALGMSVPYDNWKAGQLYATKIAKLKALGCPIYTTQSRSCQCGQPALRVWKNVGWCKGCYEKGVVIG